MEKTISEKLSLLMLAEIHQKLDIDDGVDSKLIKRAIWTDNEWGIDFHYSGILGAPTKLPEHVNQLINILDMWRSIEHAMEKFSPAEKAAVESAVKGFTTFRGFDGNNEGEYMSAMEFLVNDLERFGSFKERESLNSHSATIDGYLRKSSAHERVRASLADRHLSVAEVVEILNS
jgi:uncharacterized protein YfbU (UPF0304 family)